MRVHVSQSPDDPEHLAALAAAVPVLTAGDSLPDEIDVLVTGVPSEPELRALRVGGAVVIPFAGLPGRTRDALVERPDLRVYNLHHNAPLVAEHAVALLLAASRCLLPMDAALRRGDWRPRYAPDPSLSLEGQRALVLGFGAIGQRVARALAGLGLQVHATRRRGPFGAADDAVVHPAEALDTLLPITRALVVALPHTPRTDGLLGAEQLARLPPEAVLVNIARAPVVDEGALYAALRQGRLHGAGLDVWWRYPERDARGHTPPAETPLHELDNVVLSPHRAGHARDTEDRRTRALVALLRVLAAGQEPDTSVDVAEGY